MMDALTVTGRTIGENNAKAEPVDPSVIRPFHQPLKEQAGFIVMTGNLFDSAIMKTSVIGDDFRTRYLQRPGKENVFEGVAVVFEGPEDYHARINDPGLNIDAHSILFMRNCGPVGYPGSAEVVNMLPPDALVQCGVLELPCIGDGRQSGTSASPSILNASPEAAAGGNLALLRTGDRVRIDLNARRVDMLIGTEEMDQRRKAAPRPELQNQTPWQEIYRLMVGQLSTGACLEPATLYRGGHRPHQVGGGRLHSTGHPLQLHLSRHYRVALAGRAHRRLRRSRRRAQGLHRATAHRPSRHTRGDRRHGGLPGRRCRGLHHRHGDDRRRRRDAVETNAAPGFATSRSGSGRGRARRP
jgi:hypothetical protein